MYVKSLYLFLNQCFLCFVYQRYKYYRIGGAMFAKNYSAALSDNAFGAVSKMPLRIVQNLFR